MHRTARYNDSAMSGLKQFLTDAKIASLFTDWQYVFGFCNRIGPQNCQPHNGYMILQQMKFN